MHVTGNPIYVGKLTTNCLIVIRGTKRNIEIFISALGRIIQTDILSH